MLASKNNTGKSTVTSSKLSTSSAVAKPKKDNFFIYCYKRMIAMFASIWGKTRKGLWIVSTGTNLMHA